MSDGAIFVWGILWGMWLVHLCRTVKGTRPAKPSATERLGLGVLAIIDKARVTSNFVGAGLTVTETSIWTIGEQEITLTAKCSVPGVEPLVIDQ